MSINLITQYNELIKTKAISANKYQLDLIKDLNKLKTSIEQNQKRLIKQKIKYKSYFIYGEVGRGKSLIMDLFFQSIKIKKKRLHFHNFMHEIHNELHLIKDEKIKNPIKKIAKKYKKTYQLICLDEFHVTDIADAMILERIFRNFMEAKIIIITTSNRHPSELYKGGLQREKYLEFVNYLKKNSKILELKGESDYRLQQIQKLENYYFYPINKDNKAKFYDIFANLTSHAKTEEATLENKKRLLKIKKSSGTVALIDFIEYCTGNYSANDYNLIATKYDTIFLENIEEIKDRNIAKRFMNMIDIFYEHKNKIIFLAHINYTDIYKGKYHQFEFKRTLSRIFEMQQIEYLSKRSI